MDWQPQARRYQDSFKEKEFKEKEPLPAAVFPSVALGSLIPMRRPASSRAGVSVRQRRLQRRQREVYNDLYIRSVLLRMSK